MLYLVCVTSSDSAPRSAQYAFSETGLGQVSSLSEGCLDRQLMVVTSRVHPNHCGYHTKGNGESISYFVPTYTHVPKNELSRFERLRIMQQYKLILNLTTADSVAPSSPIGLVLLD
jgi:hypothetical protein